MLKNIHRWMGSYLKQRCARVFQKRSQAGPVHVMFCFVDHFEPDWNNADDQTQIKRVKRWVEDYPKLAEKHRDADGRHPQHTFFYPAEVYNPTHFDELKKVCGKGFGEVEIHLHHDGDTEESLKAKLEKAKGDFARHGFFGKDRRTGEIAYGFIHGNWALNNSRNDGRWCGVNNESAILKQTGCYADFTFPSAPSETQPRKINSLYYTQSNAQHPKTHSRGQDVTVGKSNDRDLMIIQGPLTLDWERRKIENGDIMHTNLPTSNRVDLWIKEHIAVKGKDDWIFVKVHTHGAPEKNADVLLGPSMDQMFQYFEKQYNDGTNYILHYVSAREMYNIIKAAEKDASGNPNEYRDDMIGKPEAQ